jgi:hypothetical protein
VVRGYQDCEGLVIEQYMIKIRPSLIVQVTRDKFELPLLVAGSVEEMAHMTGLTKDAIYKSIRRKDGQFYKVYIDEED